MNKPMEPKPIEFSYELELVSKRVDEKDFIAYFDILPRVSGFGRTEALAIAELMTAMSLYARVQDEDGEEVFPAELFEEKDE